MDKSKWQFVERYASQDGWFRIFPIGTFSRLGRTVELTREKLANMVRNFKNGLPGFRVPIKRTHDDATGKFGDVVDLELRTDGLYARPEWLPSGEQMLAEGSFQYLSPEVLWGPTDYDGQQGVTDLLMGIAALNDPFFPEAALYCAADYALSPLDCALSPPDGAGEAHQGKEGDTLDEKQLKNAFTAWLQDLFGSREPGGRGPQSEAFQAMAARAEQAEREAAALRAQAAQAEAERRHQARVERFGAALEVERYAALAGVPELLAAVEDDELAGRLAGQFRALAAQVRESELFGEIGQPTPHDLPDDPVGRYMALAASYAAEHGVDITEAYAAVDALHPDVYEAYRLAAGRRGS
jgi:phage I-like protein